MRLKNDGRDTREALFGEIDAHAATPMPPGQAHGAFPVCKTKIPPDCLEAWRVARRPTGSMRGERGAIALINFDVRTRRRLSELRHSQRPCVSASSRCRRSEAHARSAEPPRRVD
ncbi:hypothetical protein CQW49_23385 (plasmid) [Methylosinus trichosporium OB3b]|uniref:Uncharacterized protein n=1 Tax=Methylosinus trichosporium (strain ATCC 35070 / NCIMB 11131 / UNIQEM 75 / OB3b) TaxID=595536 RepID=A0A2D2D7T3_METT3|nr:hypothetical protein CQW49_23385 [Methylosinus trichosporium OB3b]OBS52104.1 hypothetical protein A8B73_12780 [Methylosinus sp. 3S-1]